MGRIAACVALVAVAGCGRLDFDALPGTGVGGDALSGDGAAVGWNLVQTTSISSSMTLSLTMPIAAGDLVVVAIETDTSHTVAGITDTTGRTYQAATGEATDSFGDNLQLWYTFAITSGATTIGASLAPAATSQAIVMWELSGITPAAPAQASVNGGTSAAPSSPVYTTTAVGELMVSAILVESNATLVPGPFTLDQNTNTNGWAHLTSNMAPIGTYSAQWTQSINGRFCTATALWTP